MLLFQLPNMCQRGGTVGEIGQLEQWGLIKWNLPFGILKNLRTMDNHLIVWETWGLGIFISEMGKGER